MKQKFLTLAVILCTFFAFSQSKELDSLTLQLAFQKPDSSKVDTSLQIIDILYNSKDYKKAFMFIDESERLAQTLKYDKGIAKAIYYKGLIFSDKDDYYNAIDNFNQAKQILEKIKDTLEVAKVNNGIGLIEIDRGNYQKGLEASLSAIKVFEERNLTQDLSSAYNNLADAYFQTDKIDKSLEYNFKALTVREQLKDTTNLSTTLRNIATLYSSKKDHQNAILYYEKVQTLLEKNSNQSLKGEILPKIGQEYLHLKDYIKAAENLVAGAKLNRRYENDEGLLRSLNGLAELNLAKRRFDLAEGQLAEANIIAKDIDNQKELLRNYQLNMELDSAKGNFEQAFMWQREYQTLKDSIFKKEYASVGIDKTDYGTTKIDNSLLEEQQLKDEANAKQISKLKLIQYLLIGAFITALTFLLLIYLKRKSRMKYTQALEEKNVKIQEQNEAILEQSKNLEEINQVKDKLFSIVSHDLKDSVTSIKGFIDLLKDGSIAKEEFNELIPELSENADNASLLLFNLLNWSKSQMESLEPNPEFFDIQDVFQEKLKLVEQKIEKKSIILIDETRSDSVFADRSMVEIIIQNLLTNAVKFCNSGDVINISNTIENGKSLFYIKDTGVGISEENQNKIFKNNSFTTIGTKNEKGTGLGLTICKELVELNHGRIWLESALNSGSKFFVELPKGKLF